MEITPEEGKLILSMLFINADREIVYIQPEIKKAEKALFDKLQKWDKLHSLIKKEEETTQKGK